MFDGGPHGEGRASGAARGGLPARQRLVEQLRQLRRLCAAREFEIVRVYSERRSTFKEQLDDKRAAMARLADHLKRSQVDFSVDQSPKTKKAASPDSEEAA